MIDPCRCPLCGQPNRCAMTEAARSSVDNTRCWCVNVSFSAELLARVPAQAERKACICQECATRAATPHE
ncbi:MAG: cysteine-rich CWC family protein [Limnohabitans sp.]|nr:cysteine-rich CWC family protein [Limnohabitans sp.]